MLRVYEENVFLVYISVIRAIGVSHVTQLAEMSFDDIFDLTAEVYVFFLS